MMNVLNPQRKPKVESLALSQSYLFRNNPQLTTSWLCLQPNGSYLIEKATMNTLVLLQVLDLLHGARPRRLQLSVLAESRLLTTRHDKKLRLNPILHNSSLLKK